MFQTEIQLIGYTNLIITSSRFFQNFSFKGHLYFINKGRDTKGHEFNQTQNLILGFIYP
jgi:hypothetical protein